MKLSSDDCKKFIIGLLIADNELSQDVKDTLGASAPPLSMLDPKSWKREQKYMAHDDDDIATHDGGFGDLNDIVENYGVSIIFGTKPEYPCNIRVFYTIAMAPSPTPHLDPRLEDYEAPYECYVQVWLISDERDENILAAATSIDMI